MYKVIKDNQSEFFLDEIPRWITHFGFGLSVIIFIALILATSIIKYPQTVTLQVSITAEGAVGTTDFKTFSLLSDHQEIKFDSPFSDTPLLGKINKEAAWIEKTEVYVPIQFENDSRNQMPFKNEVQCTGAIILSNQSMLQKLIE